MARIRTRDLRKRDTTVRQAIARHIEQGPLTARDLSALVGIREKDVALHLSHIERSLRGTDRRLKVQPAACRSCGFVFDKRSDLTTPGTCPACRRHRIDPPVFKVE